MRLTYDANADAAFIYVKNQILSGEVTETHMCEGHVAEAAVILAFDDAGRLLGIEILGARKVLPEDALAAAEQPADDSASP